MRSVHDRNKGFVAPLLSALREGGAAAVERAVKEAFAPGAAIRLCHPFQDMVGPGELLERVYAPLFAAMPDLERRDFIVMAGPRWGELVGG